MQICIACVFIVQNGNNYNLKINFVHTRTVQYVYCIYSKYLFLSRGKSNCLAILPICYICLFTLRFYTSSFFLTNYFPRFLSPFSSFLSLGLSFPVCSSCYLFFFPFLRSIISCLLLLLSFLLSFP